MKPFAFSILSLLAASFAFAQNKLTETIVVTASALPETVESTPAAVTVMTKKDIDERAARDVADLLREVPGLTVSRTGSFGKIASVFARGASSKQTLVLWNGVEINDPYFSGYNWGQLSTAAVERVEVVRGPFSSLYGADAVGGVINIITTDPAARDHASVDVATGERGLINTVGSIQQSAGLMSMNATFEHRQDNGFALNDNDRQNSILGGITWTANSAWSLGLVGRYANYDLGVPRNANDSGTAFVPTPHHRENGDEWQIALPVRGDLGPVHTELRVSESRRQDNIADPDAQSFGSTNSQRRNARLTARASTVIGTIVAGAEAERSAADNTSSFGSLDSHTRSSQAIFVEDRLSIASPADSRLELDAGVRRDRYDTFGGQTSPRLGAAWTRENHKIRAAYGEAFRAPQIGELYLPFFGNPALKAETSRSAEVGYDRYFGNNGSVSITAFHGIYRNLIFYDLAANHFANIGRARSRGIEFSTADRLGPITAGVSYTYLDSVEEPSGLQLVRRPKNSGSIAIGYHAWTTDSELVVAHVSARPDVTDLFPFGRVTNRPYTVADLTLRWNVGSSSPYVKVENLTNTKYEDVFGYPSPRRRALVGIRYAVGR